MQLAGVNKLEIDVCSIQYHHTECDVTIKCKVYKPSTKLQNMWVFVRERETMCVPVPRYSWALSVVQLKAMCACAKVQLSTVSCSAESHVCLCQGTAEHCQLFSWKPCVPVPRYSCALSAVQLKAKQDMTWYVASSLNGEHEFSLLPYLLVQTVVVNCWRLWLHNNILLHKNAVLLYVSVAFLLVMPYT